MEGCGVTVLDRLGHFCSAIATQKPDALLGSLFARSCRLGRTRPTCQATLPTLNKGRVSALRKLRTATPPLAAWAYP